MFQQPHSFDLSAIPGDGKYSFFDHSTFGGKTYTPAPAPKKKTQDPIVTGTSILGIKYKDGVMMAADTLASYGSLARFREIQRVFPVGKQTLIGGGGEYSDFQYVLKTLDELITSDEITDDGSSLPPAAIHSYLTRVLYNRRNKFDPLWGSYVIAGFRDGKSFLGVSDLQGTSYQDDTIATGFGNHLARPLLRNEFRKDMSKDDAKKLLETCMRVLFYRDARSLNRIQIATITAEGAFISDPYELSTDWSVGEITYGPEIKLTSANGDSDNNNRAGKVIG